MARDTQHGWCTLHRIAFHRDMDPCCPQCLLAGHVPFVELDWDPQLKQPIDSASGKPVDAKSVLPAMRTA